MPLQWLERTTGGSNTFIADVLANPGRYRRLDSQTVVVAVADDGVRIYDQTAEPAGLSPDEKCLLVSILKNDIGLCELKPLFRDELAAQEVLDKFNMVKLDLRMACEVNAWSRIVMPDSGLALGKTLSHFSPKYPYRHLPIAVCLRSNGLHIYRQPLGRQSPPRDEDMFLYIPPRQIEPEHLLELFPGMLGAEVTAVFRFNRSGLMRLLPRAEGCVSTAREEVI